MSRRVKWVHFTNDELLRFIRPSADGECLRFHGAPLPADTAIIAIERNGSALSFNGIGVLLASDEFEPTDGMPSYQPMLTWYQQMHDHDPVPAEVK